MSCSICLLVVLLVGILFPGILPLSEDGNALLAVKKAIKTDPLSVFGTWDASSSDPCSWAGIICEEHRVVSLNLSLSNNCCSENAFEGSLAPEIGNVSQLRMLVLPGIGFTGGIPKEISRLRYLHVLDLRKNGFSGDIPDELGNLPGLQVLNLEGNSLEGPIPQALAESRNLEEIRLGGNKLTGEIPSSFGSLQRLRHLSLPSNQLNNPIPSGLQAYCGSWEHLDLGNNFFTRGIPNWLGKCLKLEFLDLKSNYFDGGIPSEIGYLKSLRFLDVSMNRLIGMIPPSVAGCSELEFLILTNPAGVVFNEESFFPRTVMKPEFNNLVGPLPSGISSLSELQVLWSPRAGLLGDVPSRWDSSRSLRSVNLAENSLSGVFPSGLGRLAYLDLSSNRLTGRLFGVSISCMVVFNVSRNNLSGEIPSGALCDNSSFFEPSPRGKVKNFTVVHDLSRNNFTGPVPSPFIGESLMGRIPTYTLDLSDNHLSGSIPLQFFDLCTRLKLFSVDLSSNWITGELMGEIGKCESLSEFVVSRNHIGQQLPKEIGSLRNLTRLDLSENLFNGTIPGELGQLQSLRLLVLANNSFMGVIPEELEKASSLSLLDLSGNGLTGTIPVGLGNLTQLEFLLLNNNRLVGSIPESLVRISSLVSVNLAFNNLSGTVPSSGSFADLCGNENMFEGNQNLHKCAVLAGEPTPYMQESIGPGESPPDSTENPKSSRHGGLGLVVIVAITSGCAVAVVLLALAVLVQCTKQRVPRSASPRTERGGRRKEVVTFTSISFRFTYENVVRSTGNFSVDYLIGNGGFGATYKAEMMPGLVVAVKRLSIGRFQGVQQFDTEIRTLGRIRHPNLVTLIGYHASENEMFLIYNYFPRGNLETFIRNRSQGEITAAVVHRISLGIAEALAYLHEECVPKILHRDIKPSNILLDDNLAAYLADFGLARLLGASETHATTDVAGTFGYVAPEYAMTCRVSDKADVYSYGVVLLELLSGKKALDAAFSDYGHGFNIVAWAGLLIGQGRAHEIFISELWEMGPEKYLLEILKLAVMCTVDSLTVRPTMKQVVERLRYMGQTAFT